MSCWVIGWRRERSLHHHSPTTQTQTQVPHAKCGAFIVQRVQPRPCKGTQTCQNKRTQALRRKNRSRRHGPCVHQLYLLSCSASLGDSVQWNKTCSSRSFFVTCMGSLELKWQMAILYSEVVCVCLGHSFDCGDSAHTRGQHHHSQPSSPPLLLLLRSAKPTTPPSSFHVPIPTHTPPTDIHTSRATAIPASCFISSSQCPSCSSVSPSPSSLPLRLP